MDLVSSASSGQTSRQTVVPGATPYPNLSHIFVCPALMKGYWLKTLGKVADSVFSFKVGSSIWDDNVFEPLMIAFVKPLLVRPPFKVRQAPSVGEWERNMPNMQ